MVVQELVQVLSVVEVVLVLSILVKYVMVNTMT